MKDLTLPATTTPKELALHLGRSLRRLKAFARALGACRVMGNRMALTEHDVAIIMLASKPNLNIDDVREWLGEDAAEIATEMEHQGDKAPTGVVYFVRRGRQIKIGFTNNLAKRMTQFRTATTEKFEVLLTIPGRPELESYFHEKFADHRIEREWFADAEALTLFIARRSVAKL